MTYHLVFRTRGVHLRDIIDGKKTHEVRRANAYWGPRALHASEALERHEDVVGVFLSGFIIHRRRVEMVSWYWNAESALHREPSAQGKLDLGSRAVWDFTLGEETT